MYLKAAENIGLLPEQGVVVEDSVSGMEAARAAGIGYLIALGEVGKHARLTQVPGVRRVGAHLGQLPKAELFGAKDGCPYLT
jgi:beta-phosphoglucomutase-like phosphatase (HAD superfamily)